VNQPIALSLNEYIQTNADGGRAHVRGRRVVVIARYANRHKVSLSRVADAFRLSKDEVLAALLYYEMHKAEIDAEEIIDQAAV
jgi:uncharacterized protein (DUF433 family)